jgi:hypothetical protein
MSGASVMGPLTQMMFARVSELDAQISETETGIAALRSVKEVALREGRALVEAMLITNPEVVDAPECKQFKDSYRPKGTGKPRGNHKQIIDWVIEIFETLNKRELHVTEILGVMHGDPRYTVPGQGKTANVGVHLARSTRFEALARKGMWRLNDPR